MSRNLISVGKNFSFLVWLPVIISLSMTTRASCSEALQAHECVILLHGLGRTYRSMVPMARALAAAGYKTVNIDYKSREHSIEQLAMAVIPKGLDHCATQKACRIHFVTHSLGGILVRYYLSQKTISGVEGMADFLALPYSHPFIMKESEVIQQTIYFLQHGRFKVASN